MSRWIFQQHISKYVINNMDVWLSKSYENIIHLCYAEPYHK